MVANVRSVCSSERAEQPIQGVGIGLRERHISEILQSLPTVPWLEVLADNHLALGGIIPAQLEAVRQYYPMTFHCVGMSLAGTDPLDMEYLKRVKRLADAIEPAWISDHLCFTQFGEHCFHDLLPVPYTQEALNLTTDRIDQVQTFFQKKILVENVSSYLQFEQSEMSEAEFVAELLKKTDCGLLLDINNIYVSAYNHQFDAQEYLDQLPLDRVAEIHLAGYEDRGEYLLDAHNNSVSEPVWDLYRSVLAKGVQAPTLIEWDNDIPSLTRLIDEARQAEINVNACRLEKTFQTSQGL